MKSFIHHDARSVREAITLVNKYKGKTRLTAGGTDLLGILKAGVVSDYPEAIVNIKTIPGLKYIKEDETGLKIGALTTLAEVVNSPEVRQKYQVLLEAAKSVATPQIRNMATIGGNLAQDVRCWYYRYPDQLGGAIMCLRKGGKICNALAGDNRYHSVFGAARLAVYPCSSHCPAHTDIPSYLSSIRNGDPIRAARVLLDMNPMPAITGRVCPFFCEPACNRGEFDEPVAIRCIERSLGDYVLERVSELYEPPKADSGRSAAVVGSGPAGLAAAYYLRRSGHRVTVFDRLPEAGGMLLYSIPAYRLQKDVVRKQIQAFEGMGVSFELGVNIGRDVAVAELLDRFDAVLLTAGSWQEKPLGIKGEGIALSGLEFLKRVNIGDRSIPGKRVAVIGGGNVAIDVARTLLRLGAEPVVIYRRSQDEMPAFKDEVKKAVEEGIKFQFLALPTQAHESNGTVTLTCQRMKLGPPDRSGRPRPLPIRGSVFTAAFDAVIKAVGEEPEVRLIPRELRRRGHKDPSLARLLGKNLFVGGDFVNGPSTVVQALASGREAAGLIERWFNEGRSSVQQGKAESTLSRPSFNKTSRVRIPESPVSERIKDINIEDSLGLSLGEIAMEAGRCFNCGCLAVNPSDIAVALVALDAKIVTTKRIVDATGFFTASATESTVLESGEMVMEIQIPRLPDGARQNYIKFALRRPIDFAIVSVASVIVDQNGLCTDARIALGAVGPSPVRAIAAEEVLKGKQISQSTAVEAAGAAIAGANPLSMNEHKIVIAKSLVKRTVLGIP